MGDLKNLRSEVVAMLDKKKILYKITKNKNFNIVCFIFWIKRLKYSKFIKMKKSKNNNISFESCIKQLEKIVEQLELGNVDLEKSVELYERGIELKKICEEKLKKVDLQIRKIKLENNKITKEEFN